MSFRITISPTCFDPYITKQIKYKTLLVHGYPLGCWASLSWLLHWHSSTVLASACCHLCRQLPMRFLSIHLCLHAVRKLIDRSFSVWVQHLKIPCRYSVFCSFARIQLICRQRMNNCCKRVDMPDMTTGVYKFHHICMFTIIIMSALEWNPDVSPETNYILHVTITGPWSDLGFGHNHTHTHVCARANTHTYTYARTHTHTWLYIDLCSPLWQNGNKVSIWSFWVIDTSRKWTQWALIWHNFESCV